MIHVRVSVCVLMGMFLMLGGCSLPWLNGGESPPGDTTPTPSEQASTEPLVLPGEQDTPARPPAPSDGEESPSQRIAPDELENVERARELARRARRAFEQGNTEHAIELFRRASDYDPDNVEILSNIGSLHYRLENYRAAAAAYRKALNVNPEDYFSHFYVGITYYQLGENARARHHFQRALEVRPDSEEARKWLDRASPASGSRS